MIAERAPGASGTINRNLGTFPWLSGALLLASGVVVFGPVTMTWTDNPNYSFGWLIPFVSLFLFVERWPSRPAREPREFRGSLMPWMVPGLIIFFSFRMAAEADPDWRPGLWIIVGLYIASLLGWLRIYGGTAWMRHFAFPVCFLLLSLPWFFGIEYPLVQGLMRWNTLAVAETLRVFGIYAVASGNIIQLQNCQLGVEEACSGILSLQASLMMGCLLGEIYRLSIKRRVILVLVGMTLALVGNFLRTFFLAMVAFYNGADAVAQWHDTAGFSILVFTGVGTWVSSLILSLERKSTAVAGALAAELGVDSNDSRTRLAQRVALGIFTVTFLTLVITQVWFGWRELSLTHQPEWSVSLPASDTFREIPLSNITRQTLRCDAAKTGQWLDARGWQWTVFWFQYRPKPFNRVVMDLHNPDICLPAVGMKKDRDYPDFRANVNGVEFHVQPRRFLAGDEEIYLFWVVYADRGNLPPEMDDSVHSDIFSKFRAHLWDVWTGNRGVGVETMEVAIKGPADYETAQTAYLASLKTFIAPISDGQVLTSRSAAP